MSRTARTNLKHYETQAAISLKGGVERVIDSATGDIARTTSGWIEDEKYGWYGNRDNTSDFSCKFTPRYGRNFLYVSGTNRADDGNARGGTISTLPISQGTVVPASVVSLFRNGIVVKPSTSYTFSVPAEFTDDIVSSGDGRKLTIAIKEFKSDGTTTNGSNFSFETSVTLANADKNILKTYTLTFTTNASTNFISINFQAKEVGAGNLTASMYVDWLNCDFKEVSTITNSSSSPAQFYPKVTAVSSTDNIDQSQVTSNSGTTVLGNNGNNRIEAQSIVITKKQFTGFTFRPGANTGSPTFDVVMSLQADNAGSPSGTNLGTPTTVTAAQWDASNNADYTINLTETLTAGTYWMIATPSAQGDSSNYRTIRISNNSNPYTSGGIKHYNGSVWSALDAQYDWYFSTLYSKNTTNFTVSTATQSLSVTAPTTDGWSDGTVIDTFALRSNPLTLEPGENNIYYSSNGPDTADGEVDPSLQAIVTPVLYTSVPKASNRTAASNRVRVRDMGTALSFDGADDIVRGTALTHLVINNPITISFWLKSNEDGDGPIFANMLNSTDSNFHFGWRNSSSRIEGAFFTAGVPNVYRGRFGSPILSKRKWYQVAIVYDGTSLNEGTNGVNLYLNGGLQSKVSANYGGAGTDNGMAIGGQTTISTVNNDFKGVVDEFRTWSRALTAQEVSDLYFNDIVPRDGLVAEYLFNEATGSIALDTSGNGNDGTITGATYTTDVPIIPRDNV